MGRAIERFSPADWHTNFNAAEVSLEREVPAKPPRRHALDGHDLPVIRFDFVRGAMVPEKRDTDCCKLNTNQPSRMASSLVRACRCCRER